MIDPSNFNFDSLDAIKQPMQGYEPVDKSWAVPIAIIFLGICAVSVSVFYYENQEKNS